MVKSYRDLIVWQKAVALVTEIYNITRPFPREEMFGLTSQARRAAISIPANIAEGFGLRNRTEFKQYLRIALGSLFELQTHIQIAFNLKYISQPIFDKLNDSSREIERLLSALQRSIKPN